MTSQRVYLFRDQFDDGSQNLPVLSGNGSASETGGALVVSVPNGVNADWYTFGRNGILPYVGLPAVLANYAKIYYEFTIKSWTTANPSYSHLVAGLCASDTSMWWIYTYDSVNFGVQRNWGAGDLGVIATSLPRKFRFVWDVALSTIAVQCETSPAVWTDIVATQAIGLTPVRLGFGLKTWNLLPACSAQYEDVEIYADLCQVSVPADGEGIEDVGATSAQGTLAIGQLLTGATSTTNPSGGLEDSGRLGEAPGDPVGISSILDRPGSGIEDTAVVRLGLVPTYRPTSFDPNGSPHFLDALGSPRLRSAFEYDATRDPWNDPVTYALTGYARDGYYHISGVKQETRFLDRFDNGVVDLSTDIPAGGHIVEAGGRLNIYLNAGEHGDWSNTAQKSPAAYTTIPAAAFTNEIQEYTTRLSGYTAPAVDTTVGMTLWSTRSNLYLFDVRDKTVLAVSTLISGTWTQGVAVALVADPNTVPLTLRIERHTGTGLLRFLYSTDDGLSWFELYSTTAAFTPTKIGMIAKNWSATYAAVSSYWDYLRIGSARAPWANEQGVYWRNEFEASSVGMLLDAPVGSVVKSGGKLNFSFGAGTDAQWWSGYYYSPLAYVSVGTSGSGRFAVTTKVSALNGPSVSDGFLLCLMGTTHRANAYRFEIAANQTSFTLGGTKLVSGSASALTLSPGGAIPNPNTTPSLLRIVWDSANLVEFWHSTDDGYSWTRHYSGTLEFTPTKVGVSLDNWSPLPAGSASCDYLRVTSLDRGTRADFPIRSLLVTSQSELVIFDMDAWPLLPVWMRFRLGPASAFYLLGRIADSLRAAKMLNGTLVAGSVNNGTDYGGMFSIDFKRTGTDFALLVRTDGWWKGTSGYDITQRNRSQWAGQGTGFTLDSEYVHYIDATFDAVTSGGERMWISAGSEDLIRVVEILANQPQFDYDPVGSLVGPFNDFVSGLKCSLFDSAGWLWLAWGPYVFRCVSDFRGGVVVMGSNPGSDTYRHQFVQLPHPDPVVVYGITQVMESIYAATNRGVYRINRFTMQAYLCYTIPGGGGGGRLNQPQAGELLGGESLTANTVKGMMVNRAGSTIGYLAVASAQATLSLSLPAHGGGAVTIIRLYDDAVVDRRTYTGLSSGLTEDGAWFIVPFGS